MTSVEDKTNEIKCDNESKQLNVEKYPLNQEDQEDQEDFCQENYDYVSSGQSKYIKGLDTPDNSELDSTDSTDSTDSVDELTLLLNPLSFTENSELYVVSVDGLPQFYVKDEHTAERKMWEVTRLLSARHVLDGHHTQFLKINNNELHILSSYRFFLIAYDQIIHKVSYHRVKECV